MQILLLGLRQEEGFVMVPYKQTSRSLSTLGPGFYSAKVNPGKGFGC